MSIKTIINNFENLNIDKIKSSQLVLKFNSELKKSGFKKVFMGSEMIRTDMVKDGLTLVFLPSYDGDVSYREQTYRRDSFTDLTSYLVTLGGCGSLDYYFGLSKNVFEDQIELKIRYKERNYHIGDYLPTRNVVIIYFPTFLENWKLGKENKYIFQLLEWIKEIVIKYKIKEGNVKELKEKIFIMKFTKSINSEILTAKNTIDNCNFDIKKYKPQIADCYNKILTSRIILSNLKQTLKNIRGSLLKKVEEIRNLKFVKKVELKQEGVVLEFEKIFIKVKGKDIEMGDYIITLMPNEIKIINKEPVKYRGTIYHSCHIIGGDICFGDENAMAYELLGKMELKKLTHFLFLYLKSYNPEDTHLSMNYWIEGKENGGVVPDRDEEITCGVCGNNVRRRHFNVERDCCNDCRRL